MIKLEDLQEAIAECEGERSPNANTCIKLAAFYTIKDHLYGNPPAYSYAPAPAEEFSYKSETEFGEATANMTKAEMMPIIEELMETIKLIYPKLYQSAMRKFTKKY